MNPMDAVEEHLLSHISDRTELIPIPMERCIIDAISLDEEIQLERELIDAELAPIDAAWAARVDRATWEQPLPMAIARFEPWEHPNFWVRAFIEHIVYQGEVAFWPLQTLRFRTALELFRERWDESIDEVVDGLNLLSKLRYPKAVVA